MASVANSASAIALRCLSVACTILLHNASLSAQLPATQLSAVFPAGSQPGKTLDVTILGTDLDDVDQLLFNHPGINATRKMADPTPFDDGPQPVPNTFVVTVNGDVPPADYEVRCRGRFGISNRRIFSINPLPVITETEPNGGNDVPPWTETEGVRTNAANEISIPGIADGQAVQGPDVDWYRFQGKAGQQVLVTAICRRLDSRMDPLLTVLREDGNVLAESQPGPDGEVFADVRLPSDGTFFIKVHDAVFAQGPGYVYRLLVTSAPQIDFVFPPAGLAGTSPEFTLYGRNLPGGQPSPYTINGVQLQQLKTAIAIPGDITGKLPVSRLVEPHQAGLDGLEYVVPGSPPGTPGVLITVATAPPVLETANDSAASMQQLTWPCEVHGQFYPQRDVDWFSFTAKKDETLIIELISQRLGMPTDASLLLQQEVLDEQKTVTVKDLQFVDDVGMGNNNNNQARAYRHEFDERTTDPVLLFKAPADGTYRLMIRDGLSALKSDPRLTYRLIVRPPQPDFRLAAAPARSGAAFQLRKGGRETLHVTAFRLDGFDGEIRAVVSGLPEGVTSEEIVIGPGSTTGTLVLTAADAAKGAGTLKVQGRAVVNGQEVQREARYAAAAAISQNNQPNANVPSLKARLVSGIQVSVSELEAAPQTLTIGNGQPLETSRGGVLKIPYQVRRADGSAGNITGFPIDVPAGTQLPQVQIGGNANGEFELRFTAQAQPGLYSFYLAGFNQGLQYKRSPDLVDKAKVRQERVAKVLTEAQQKVQQLTQENQKRTQEQTQANTAVTQATTAKQQADQKKTAADTALQQAEAALKQKGEQSAANPADETLKQQAAQAQTAREAAVKAADEAKLQQDAAVKKLDELTAAKKLADEAKEKAQADLTAAQQFQTQAQQEKQRADQFVQQKTQESNQRQVNVDVPSNSLQFRLTEHPLVVDVFPDTASVKAGEKLELPVKVTRRYDYKAGITLQTTIPQGLTGLQVPSVTIPDNQGEVKLQITTAANSTVGDHLLTVRFTMNFNGQPLTFERPLKLQITPAPPAAQ